MNFHPSQVSMFKSVKAIALTVIAISIYLLCPSFSFAQSSQIIPVEDTWVYDYINRLQKRGYLLELNPTRLPYIYKDVNYAISKIDIDELSDVELEWLNRLKRYLPVKKDEEGKIGRWYNMNPALRKLNTDQLNLMRPVGDGATILPYWEFRGAIEKDGFIGHAGLRFDLFYEYDKIGLDAVRRWNIRNENSYVGYANSYLKVYVGRFSNQWSQINEPSTLISANPRTMDQINIRFGGQRFSFSSIFARLDKQNGSDDFTGHTTYGQDVNKRYLTMKRLDFRPTRKFMMTLAEAVLYSGPRADPNVRYFNPVGSFTFLSANIPSDEANNMMLNMAIWGQWRNWTTSFDFMVDDFLYDRADVDNGGKYDGEKNTYAFTSSLVYASRKHPFDIALSGQLVGYQTYNSDKIHGRYLYLRRGITTNYTDFAWGKGQINWYADKYIRGLRLSPYLAGLLQGEQNINQTFARKYPEGHAKEGQVLPMFLTGTVEKTARIGTEIFWNPTHWYWIKADVGYNHTRDYLNVDGATNSKMVYSVEAGLRFNFHRKIPINF